MRRGGCNHVGASQSRCSLHDWRVQGPKEAQLAPLLGPWWDDAVHSRVCDGLAEVLGDMGVEVDQDSALRSRTAEEIHAAAEAGCARVLKRLAHFGETFGERGDHLFLGERLLFVLELLFNVR